MTLNTIPHTFRNTRCHINIPLSHFVSNTNKPKLHESCSTKSKPYSMLQIKTFFVVLLKKSFVIHLCCLKKYSVREIDNFPNRYMSFIFWNSFSWVSVHLKTAFCFVSSRRFAVAAVRSGMKVPFDLIIQRNDRSSSLDVGFPASCTAWTLFGPGFIPFMSILNPQKGISGWPRMYLLGLTVSPAFSRTVMTASSVW